MEERSTITSAWFSNPVLHALFLCAFLLAFWLIDVTVEMVLPLLHSTAAIVWFHLIVSAVMGILSVILFRKVRILQCAAGFPVQTRLNWNTGFWFWSSLVLSILLFVGMAYAYEKPLVKSILDAYYFILDAVQYSLFLMLLLNLMPQNPRGYHSMMLPMLILVVPFFIYPIIPLLSSMLLKENRSQLLQYGERVFLDLLLLSVVAHGCVKHRGKLLRILARTFLLYPLLDILFKLVVIKASGNTAIWGSLVVLLLYLAAIVSLHLHAIKLWGKQAVACGKGVYQRNSAQQIT